MSEEGERRQRILEEIADRTPGVPISRTEKEKIMERQRKRAEYLAGIRPRVDEDDVKLKLRQERRDYQAQLEAEQDIPTKQPEKKMGIFFFLIGLWLSIVGDLIDFITAGTIGWLVGLVIDAILLLMFGLSKSGRKQFKRVLIAVIGESIPFINMLPFRTIVMIWSFTKSRSKIARKVDDRANKTRPVINALKTTK